ncbi:MAG: hypothetical protein ABIE47_14790 [Pseudomonadota bacterium]
MKKHKDPWVPGLLDRDFDDIDDTVGEAWTVHPDQIFDELGGEEDNEYYEF